MKIVICGAEGMLGSDIREAFEEQGLKPVALNRKELDISNLREVNLKLSELRPELIINAAAYTDVDGCEREPELAYRVNCLGPRNLAIAANNLGVSLVHISTDYVFGGKGCRAYREYDPINPQSEYGKSKADGETAVRTHCPRHYIIRTAWLFGKNGKNFVQTILRLAKEKEVLTIVNDQVGCPTYTRDLAEAITKLVEQPSYGTYHITNSGQCTWYDFTREILRQSGIDNVTVLPISTEQLNRPANRPAYSVLDNWMWQMEGYSPLRPFEQALADYLSKNK